MKEDTFADKNVFVLGGSGGIGAAICRELAPIVKTLVIHGGHESPRFSNLVVDLQTKTKVIKIVENLENFHNEDSLPTSIKENLLHADIVIVTYGPFIQKSLCEMKKSEWNFLLSQNLELPGVIISTVLPYLKQKQWGRIILFGGTRTFQINGYVSTAAYSAAKTGIASLVRSVAKEGASFGITCNGIFPGFTETEYVSNLILENQVKKMPQHRLVTVKEIAESVFFLLNQPMINGACLPIDGGWEP